MTVGATISNHELARDGNFIYLAGFDAAGIHGSLRKMVIATESDGTPRIASTAQWDAADILTGTEGNPPRLSFRERKIFIGKQTGTNWATVPFEWDVLSESQKMLLSTATAKETSARQWVDYLRGARDLEIGRPQGSLRHRKNLLGDIVNSQPLYVGAPTSDISGSEYQAFHARYGSRRKAVYVGANDGMLHAFDAEDGHELFAYIPNVLLPSLPQLTRPDYRHHSYVDGRLAVAEALVGGAWRTILAAGMGGGAQGVFALDVSDPSDFSGGRGALWEFTDRDDPDMGNVLGTPMIARFMTSKVKGVPQYKYFAVVANGVNSYQVDGDKRYSIGAVGALFLLALDKPASVKWQEGVNYFKFKTPAGEPDLANGLMSPAAITDGSGVVRFIYAGDLQGNLWRFDFDGGMPKKNVGTSIVSIFTAV
ncbi:MAG: pilus assembly protein PilY, partial [Proteobacteria bacterium]|nr:pilus assembly protein PilY [Pseudomonadota bacterium]